MAEDFSPRYECRGANLVVIDVSGLERLFGEPRAIGDALYRSAVDRGLRVQIAIAATRTAAEVLATTRPGVTVIERGDERRALAPIAIGVLQRLEPHQTMMEQKTPRGRPQTESGSVVDVLDTFTRWGLRTLGDLATLPSDELAARVGQQGLRWQAVARGQDVGPLVPTLAAERFAASIDLEWPIEGLEPLSFVLTRLLEPLSTRLERQDRGVAVLYVTLGLVAVHDIQRHESGGSEKSGGSDRSGREDQKTDQAHPTDQADQTSYARSLQLPAPIRDVRTLRTLLLLDLESHPPPAPIERVSIVIDPTPGRMLQHALFVRARPTPEQLSTLVARLNALMGEDRVGQPLLVDSYRPGAFAMQPFGVDQDRGRRDPSASSSSPASAASVSIVAAVRRCRRPVPARVTVVGGRPTTVTTDRRGFAGGHVTACAGPWRTSGHWWSSVTSHQSPVTNHQSSVTSETGDRRRLGTGDWRPETGDRRLETPWNRDEWDVWLGDDAVYRIFQDRITERWFIDAVAD